MQRMIPLTGTLASCPGCGKQPKHWIDQRKGGQHFCECAICGTRTANFPTFQEAVESWERHESGIIRNVR
jgi:uncharacterized Zn finger protein